MIDFYNFFREGVNLEYLRTYLFHVIILMLLTTVAFKLLRQVTRSHLNALCRMVKDFSIYCRDQHHEGYIYAKENPWRCPVVERILLWIMLLSGGYTIIILSVAASVLAFRQHATTSEVITLILYYTCAGAYFSWSLTSYRLWRRDLELRNSGK